MALTFSHKYIKNTSTCGTVLTEHLLNAGRRPQTPKRARKSPHNWVGQKKKGKKKKERERKESGRDLHPRDEAVKEGRFAYPGKSPHLQGNQPGWRGSFGASEESTVTGLWRAKQRETCTDGRCHCPALPSLRCSPAGAGRVWVLRLGFWRSGPGRGLGLALWRQLEGARVWCDTTEGVWEEVWACQRGKASLSGGT